MKKPPLIKGRAVSFKNLIIVKTLVIWGF